MIVLPLLLMVWDKKICFQWNHHIAWFLFSFYTSVQCLSKSFTKLSYSHFNSQWKGSYETSPGLHRNGCALIFVVPIRECQPKNAGIPLTTAGFEQVRPCHVFFFPSVSFWCSLPPFTSPPPSLCFPLLSVSASLNNSTHVKSKVILKEVREHKNTVWLP